MEMKFIQTLEIFEELFYPTFYSYKVKIGEKEQYVLTTFAHYDEENDTDYFYNAYISKDTHKKLKKGKKEIRKIFKKSIKENFFTNKSPENMRIIKPINLNIEIEEVLPDAGLYVSKVDGEYQIIDFEEIKKSFNLNEVDLKENLFVTKPKIEEQIKNLVESGSSHKGVVIAFGNDNETFVLNVIGKLMSVTGDLFRKVSDNQLKLEVLSPFKSSFGISMNISSNSGLDLEGENDEINKFMMLLNMVSNTELFNEELIALYQKTEREKLSSLLKLIAENKVEMNTAYFKYDENNKELSNLQTNKITVENAEYFMDKISEEKKEVETHNISLANLYKIDIHKNEFGLTNIQTGEDIKGSINSDIDKKETFNVPSIIKVTIKKTIEKNEFTQIENIRYSLESIEKIEDDSTKKKN
ncbi:hypothetical protein K4R68_03810 [Staphylococcus epidermidis]|uniref:hypothetical protein n=1 Tax=Staphylococcus epidermidis TaxID=1282 RepID=UPI0021A5CFF3|nr:hypothetical protein [Staphylococcus epidermidis]MCG1168383.1 hypothetical protein [Staphylococcus epidermidis]MCG1298534.1 hypothetical protein [Staphylococcus epidermidis]MCG1590982.1 hypothetical protein [Staphylococcus epidermidis]MCG1832063.1 hypothetical protein [Staphylococcus epidermidis]MCG2070593.1 hypothetical protein [Staphylococcus epidermidis]